MLLDHKNMRRVLGSLDKSRAIEIFCNRNLHSICSLFIFTQILKKELLKYQIEFKSLDPSRDLYFRVDEEEFILSNEDDCCSCTRKETVGTAILYNVAKSMDFLRTETVWPAAVCHTFYRVFTKPGVDEEGAKENAASPNTHKNRTSQSTCNDVCEYCLDFQKDLMFSIRTLNCKFEGVFYSQRNKLDFLTGSTLFLAIKNNLGFILDRKLFYNKSASCDRKIHEFLARKGISIHSANEQYTGLDSATKSLAAHSFGEESKFIMKSGHDIEISAIEHAFLIYFYLYKEKEMYAYMCLQKRKLIDFDKSCKFYHKIVSLFKEATITASKAEDIVFFRVKANEFSPEQRTTISEILLYFLKIYLRQRSMHAHRIVLSYSLDGTPHQVLYSEDCNLERIESELKEVAGPNAIKICSKDLGAVVKQLVN